MPKKILFILFILLLAAGIGYYIWRDIVRHRVANIPPAENQQLEQLQQNVYDSVMHISAPNLDRPINITVDLPEDARKIAREKIETISRELKENSNNLDNWLVLGIYRKMIGDYEGAREVWEYAGKISPKNSTSFNNLGDLYAYYLKDSVKAEENFLKALENGPDQIYIYRNTHDFYRLVLKDDAKAKNILEQGIKLNPGSAQDLENLLNNF